MPLSTMDALNVDEWDRMIDVNIRGLLHGIAAVLPVMREQGAGHVGNLASVSGLRVDPTAAVYSATKSRCAPSRRGCGRRAARCASRWSVPG